MDTATLQLGLAKIVGRRRVVFDVLPYNHLPTRLRQFPTIFIVNTQNSSLPGQHWFVIYAAHRLQSIEVLDPLGGVTHQRLQGLFSTTCGHFCLAFVYCRLVLGLSFRTFVDMFSDDYQFNDAIAYNLANTLLADSAVCCRRS
jgi:hypothetical protein